MDHQESMDCGGSRKGYIERELIRCQSTEVDVTEYYCIYFFFYIENIKVILLI